MKVKIDLDDTYDEPVITIQAKELTPALKEVIDYLKGQKQTRLLGVKDQQTIVIDPKKVDYVFSERRKVYAKIGKDDIQVNMKLYEVEAELKHHAFVRFSKSVVGNVNRIHQFESSFNGSLCVHFKSGNKEYISRKFVSDVKTILFNEEGHHD
ncbi:MAG TPA: LytTR family DNA-binding domain-containing protein [Pseudogracilibacillus sp.]|nr:LytTR family DNA-binding domain-containing protein [Pseudogracilibacillus sp.]